MNLNEVLSLFNLPLKEESEITNVCIDSKKATPGSLFVALKGSTHDGHDFIKDAHEKGAVATLALRAVRDVDIAQIIVKDPVKALGEIAKYYRNKFSLPVIALTGSNGKTSVKELIGAMLPEPSFTSYANFNNHIGVPLNVLSLKKDHKYAVFELGASSKGDIAYTVDMVKPKVTLINNIAFAHIKGFGSIDEVALAKSEIHTGLDNNGYAIINADDNYKDFFISKVGKKNTISFSAVTPCDVYASNIEFDSLGKASFILHVFEDKRRVKLNVPGSHNILNTLAASASVACLNVNFENIIKGIKNFHGVSGRMSFKPGINNSLIVDDTYNANLQSVLAALKVVTNYKGKKIFVFGDIGELGDLALSQHREVGLNAKELNIDILLTFGDLSEHASLAFGKNAWHYTNKNELVQDLLNYLDKDTIVLVKGSRSQKMEEVVNSILNLE